MSRHLYCFFFTNPGFVGYRNDRLFVVLNFAYVALGWNLESHRSVY